MMNCLSEMTAASRGVVCYLHGFLVFTQDAVHLWSCEHNNVLVTHFWQVCRKNLRDGCLSETVLSANMHYIRSSLEFVIGPILLILVNIFGIIASYCLDCHVYEHCRCTSVFQVDDELNWKAHIDHIFNKLVKFTGIFYQLRSKLSPDWLKNIYFAFVYPHILYGVEIYANTFDTYLDRLRKLNNKILRIMQNQPKRSHVFDLYKNYNLLPLD